MSQLWHSYGWLPCPLNAIPHTALVAETTSGDFIAFLAMYSEPRRMGFIDWALKDRSRPQEESDKALQTLFDALVDVAKSNGCAFIYSMTKTKSWGDKLTKYGMQVAETNATTYILALQDSDTGFIKD